MHSAGYKQIAIMVVAALAFAGAPASFGRLLTGKVHAVHINVIDNGRVSNKALARLGMARGQSDQHTGIHDYRIKSNGLTILLVERHAAPVVTILVLYKAGSRNEAVGYTGATHFLEHMMFKGSARYDPLKRHGIEDVLKPMGGLNNATTWFDRTSYFEAVPSADLPVCLDFEADRMRNLFLRQSDRNAEMTVVRNELERNENVARISLETKLFAAAYQEHPYHHPTIGWRSDVEGVPNTRLRQFYNDFYWPNNATLIVIGDFKPEQALRTISQKFGKLPRSPHPIPCVYTVEPPQEGERRFIVQRGADQPKVMVGFHICRASDPDIYPLAVIESILGDNDHQSSRLYKRLIDSGLASDVYAFAYELRDPGLFVVCATCSPGTAPEKVEEAIIDEVDRLKGQPVKDSELNRAETSIEKKLVLATADPVRLAELIGEAVAAADWQFWTGYPEKIHSVTITDIVRVSRKFFVERNRTVGYYLPRSKQAALVKRETALETPPVSAVPGGIAHFKPVHSTCRSSPLKRKAGMTNVSSKPGLSACVVRKVLPNGLTVLVLPISGIGTVSVAGKILAGNCFAYPEKRFVPEAMCRMLNKGTLKYSKDELADSLDFMGTSLNFDCEDFWISFDADIAREDLGSFFPLLSDMLRRPMLPEDELTKSKAIFESVVRQHMADTRRAAVNALHHALYTPECVYYQKSFAEQLAEIPTLAVSDLRAFHRAHYIPANTVLAIAGDVTPASALKLVEYEFGDWTGPPRDVVPRYEVEQPDTAKDITVSIPDRENTDISIGRPADVGMKSADYLAALVGNAALGQSSFSTRLSPIREKFGLSYDISSDFADIAYGGAPWVIECSTNPNNVARAVELIDRYTGAYLKSGITDREIANESRHLAGQFLVDLRTPSQIAGYLARFELVGLGPKYIDEFPRKLQLVGKAQVNRAIRKYFRLDHAVTVLSGTMK